MRLDVRELAAEERLHPLDGERLDGIGELLPAIVAAARIAFGVFVCQDRAVRKKDVLRDIVLARNELKPFGLALCLPRDGVEYFRFFIGAHMPRF